MIKTQFRGTPGANKIVLLLLGSILVLSPFFHGLYFNKEALIFLFGIGVLTLIHLISNRKILNQSIDLIDIGFGGLALWYVISLCFAVNIGDALIGTMRILGYLALYYTASRSLNKRAFDIGTWLLAATGTILVLAAIGSKIGFPPLKSAWDSSMASTFEYRNALGGYLLMVIPIMFYLYRNANVWWKKYLSLAGLYFVFFGLLGTQSRGTYIIFSLVLVLCLIIFEKKDLWLIPIVMLTLWAAAAGWTVDSIMAGIYPATVLLWPLAGVVLVWIAQFVYEKLMINNTLFKTLGAVFLLIVLVIVSLPLYNLQPNKLDEKNNSTSINTTINSIAPGDPHWQERLVIYKNSLQMAIDRPVFGFGADGWSSAYRNYEDYLYNSTETHSEPLKILVEAGFPGLIFYGIIWIGFLYLWLSAWPRRHASPEYLVGVGLLGIFLHSLIDFDLSESSIFFTMIILLASLRMLCIPGIKGESLRIGLHLNLKNNKILPGAFVLVSLVLLVGSPLLATGLYYATQGAQHLNNRNYGAAIDNYQNALRFNPYQATVYADLARLQAAQAQNSRNKNLMENAKNNMDCSLKLNQADPTLATAATSFYFSAGELQKAYYLGQRTLELADLYPENYERAAQLGVLYAEQLIERGRGNEAKQILTGVIGLPQMVELRLSKIPPSEMLLWTSEPHLVVTPMLNLFVGEAQALKGDYTEAMATLRTLDSNADFDKQTALWQNAIINVENNLGQELSQLPQHKSVTNGDLERLITILKQAKKVINMNT